MTVDSPGASAGDRQFAAVMDAARRHYLTVSDDTIRAFEQIAAGLASRPDDTELLGSLRRELHRVHGTAGTVGFMEAGSLAGAMSATVRRWEGDPALDRDRRSETVAAFAELLRKALSDRPASSEPDKRRLLLMDLPADVAGPLVSAAVRRGIAAEMTTADELEAAIALPHAWGVVARGMTAGSAPANGMPRVLLRDGTTTTETLPPRTHVLDRRTAADDVLDALEHAASREGAARSTLLADDGIAPDVVVVEDDVALADVISFALTARALTHRVYHTGPDGLGALRVLRTSNVPPIVLLDIDLPGLDGHSVHEQLQRERPGAFRVVFMSGHAGEADQRRALEAGALDFLVKPVSLRILMDKVAVWRERSGDVRASPA